MDAIPRGDEVVGYVESDGLGHIVVEDVIPIVGSLVRHIAPDLVGCVCQDRSEHTRERVEDEVHSRLSCAAFLGIRLLGI